MHTFAEFQPTGFDPLGAAFPGMDRRRDWLVVPVSRSRDSGAVADSNFEAALKGLGGESRTVEVHRLGHWGCGWLEIILVKPDTEAARVAEEIEGALADYPVLDDSDLSERENEEYLDTWRFTGESEFRRKLLDMADGFCENQEEYDAIEAALDDAGYDKMREFYEAHVDQAYETHDDGVYLTIEYAVAAITERELRAFVRELRGEPDPNAPDPNQGVLPL